MELCFLFLFIETTGMQYACIVCNRLMIFFFFMKHYIFVIVNVLRDIYVGFWNENSSCFSSHFDEIFTHFCNKKTTKYLFILEQWKAKILSDLCSLPQLNRKASSKSVWTLVLALFIERNCFFFFSISVKQPNNFLCMRPFQIEKKLNKFIGNRFFFLSVRKFKK